MLKLGRKCIETELIINNVDFITNNFIALCCQNINVDHTDIYICKLIYIYPFKLIFCIALRIA